MAHAYLSGSNEGMTATDTQKNSVYYVAKRLPLSSSSPEAFAKKLAEFFVERYPLVSAAKIIVKVKPWCRHGEHEHGFVLDSGRGERLGTALAVRGKRAEVAGGIEGLTVLKTTQSGYEGYLKDNLTLLSYTRERILASSVSALWAYDAKNMPPDFEGAAEAARAALIRTFLGPDKGGVYSPSVQYTMNSMAQSVLQSTKEMESITISMPNIHFIPCNSPKTGVTFEDDIYVATSEPHGQIECTVCRKGLEKKAGVNQIVPLARL